MNKYYVIVPAALLLGFVFIYRSAVAKIDAREIELKHIAEAKAQAEADQRKELERKATEDAIKQQKIRDEEEAAKEKKKETDYQNAMSQLKNEADGYNAEAEKLAKQSADLEIALVKARSLRDRTSAEAFDLTKAVEAEKINRRTAELEIQRLVAMVGEKASASVLTAMPPPPPPAR